jgi:hypothetical protein
MEVHSQSVYFEIQDYSLIRNIMAGSLLRLAFVRIVLCNCAVWFDLV